MKSILACLTAAAAIALTLATPTNSCHAASVPPSIDPTYGMTVALHTSPQTPPPLAANWIWARRTADGQTVYFRHTFSLTASPRHAVLYVTADDGFSAYVNGHLVGQSAADSVNNSWQHVQKLNVAPYLTPGVNVIAAQATNETGAAGLLAALEAQGEPGFATGSQWKVLDDVAPDQWNSRSFDDTLWAHASVAGSIMSEPWLTGAGGLIGWPGLDSLKFPYLRHMFIPVVSVTDVSPGATAFLGLNALPGSSTAMLTVTPPSAGGTEPTDLVLDFGKELTGRLWITSTTSGVVQAGLGESEDEAVFSPWIKLQTLRLDPENGVGTQYTAFRYVHLIVPAVLGARKPIQMHVAVDHLYYPVEYKGSFACSDPLLTRIWYTGAYTAHSCMQEDVWDAPKRDRARWSGDLQVSGETISNVFGDKFLTEQTLSRLRQDAQGGQPETGLPSDDVNGIPGYSIAWFCTLADLYRHTGDLAYVKSQHDAIISLLEYLRGDAGDTPVFSNTRKKWMFTDWADGFSPDPGSNVDQTRVDETTQMFLVRGTREASYLLRQIGDSANAEKYALWSDDLAARTRQAVAPTPGSVYSDRLQEDAMAIYSGTATPAQDAVIWDTVMKPGSKSWERLPTPYYNNFVIAAMSMSGHTEEATQFIRWFWGGMIRDGATTFYEGYDPRWEKNHFHQHLQADFQTGYSVSLCHGWSTGCTNFLTERVLGVTPTGPGYQTALIAPDLGDLSWASGDIPTPHGVIHARADRHGTGTLVTLTIPPGIAMTVQLAGSAMSVNGRLTESVRADGKACITLNRAGTYRVVAD